MRRDLLDLFAVVEVVAEGLVLLFFLLLFLLGLGRLALGLGLPGRLDGRGGRGALGGLPAAAGAASAGAASVGAEVLTSAVGVGLASAVAVGSASTACGFAACDSTVCDSVPRRAQRGPLPQGKRLQAPVPPRRVAVLPCRTPRPPAREAPRPAGRRDNRRRPRAAPGWFQPMGCRRWRKCLAGAGPVGRRQPVLLRPALAATACGGSGWASGPAPAPPRFRRRRRSALHPRREWRPPLGRLPWRWLPAVLDSAAGAAAAAALPSGSTRLHTSLPLRCRISRSRWRSSARSLNCSARIWPAPSRASALVGMCLSELTKSAARASRLAASGSASRISRPALPDHASGPWRPRLLLGLERQIQVFQPFGRAGGMDLLGQLLGELAL